MIISHKSRGCPQSRWPFRVSLYGKAAMDWHVLMTSAKAAYLLLIFSCNGAVDAGFSVLITAGYCASVCV